MALRYHPAHYLRQRVGQGQPGSGAAHPGTQPLHRRHLQQAENPRRRAAAGGHRAEFDQLQSTVQRRFAPFWCVGPHMRHRSGARPGRQVLRTGGQPAGALGRILHAGEPGNHQAGAAGTVSQLQHPAGGRLPLPPLPHPGFAVAAGIPAAALHRGPDPGHLQFSLLRSRTTSWPNRRTRSTCCCSTGPVR